MRGIDCFCHMIIVIVGVWGLGCGDVVLFWIGLSSLLFGYLSWLAVRDSASITNELKYVI